MCLRLVNERGEYGGVVGLVFPRKFVESRKCSIDNALRLTGPAMLHGGKKTFDSPFFTGRVCGFDDAVGVRNDEISRIHLNRLRLVDGFGEDSDGRRGGMQPFDSTAATD